MKFLINLIYWERPNTVQNALRSIRDMHYDNWELVFLDDGSTKPGEPIVREILKDHLDKIKFINTHQTNEDKAANLSNFGRFMNEAILASDADAVITVCDDDGIVSNALSNLDKWFTEHPKDMWTWCHVIEYNPETEVVGDHLLNRTTNWHNRSNTAVRPDGWLDCSQVIFRREILNGPNAPAVKVEEDCMWQWPQTSCLDAGLFYRVWRKYGDVPFSGFLGQFKAVFPDQLGKREVRGEVRGKLPLDIVPTP